MLEGLGFGVWGMGYVGLSVLDLRAPSGLGFWISGTRLRLGLGPPPCDSPDQVSR